VSDHPSDLWAYALGDVGAERSPEIERHLKTCAACRGRVQRWRSDLVAAVESLPPVVPTPAARARDLAAAQAALPPTAVPTRRTPVQRGVAGAWVARWLPLSLAAIVLAASAGVAWQRHDAWRAVEAERALVAAWLTRDDVVRLALPREDAGSRSPGTVMVAEDGVILVVMRAGAPDGKAFQVWGQDDRGATSLGTLGGTVLRADASKFREVWVTLEPSGGSGAPTHVIGRVPTGS